jgi:putative DNA primase/helicase
MISTKVFNSSLFKDYINGCPNKVSDHKVLDENEQVKNIFNEIDSILLSLKSYQNEHVEKIIDGFGSESVFLREMIQKKCSGQARAYLINESIEERLMRMLQLSAGIYSLNGRKAINCELFALFINRRFDLIAVDGVQEHKLMVFNHSRGFYSSDLTAFERIIFEYLQTFAFGDELPISSIEVKVEDFLMKSAKHIEKNDLDRNYFAFSNCDLEFRTGQMVQHDPSHLITLHSDITYNKKIHAPLFRDFLADVFQNDLDTIEFLQEFFGYCLISAQKAQMFLVIVGPGANGKSVLVSLLSKFVGTSNVSAVPFEDLNSPFSLQPMIGKKINIATENSCQIASSSKLKAITSGDEVSINRKNLPEIAIKLPIKLVFVLNANLLFNDKSYGLARRLYLLRMDKVVDKSEQDSHLGEKLSTELPGILNWSLDGLRRLIQNDFRFTSSKSMEEAKRRVLEKTSPVAVFVKEIVFLKNGNVMKTREVHDYFLNWCNSKGIMIGEYTSAAKFWKAFSDEFLLTFNLVLRRGKSGTSIVRDIGLK